MSLLRRRNIFEFTPPTIWDKAYHRLRFSKCYSHAALTPALDERQEELLAVLRRIGSVVLDQYISEDRLRPMQREFGLTLENLKFETPCLAQTRVDPRQEVPSYQMAGHIFPGRLHSPERDTQRRTAKGRQL